MNTSALRLAIRLARREVRHRPGRTVLVAFLVAIPVALMSIVVVLFRTDSLTPLEEWQRTNGAADALLGVRNGASVEPADLPPGSRVVTFQIDFRLIRTNDGQRELGEITNLPVADPLATGIVAIAGRAPETAGEVLLSAHMARAFGVGLGGTLDFDRPLDRTVTVVGIGRWDARDQRVVVFHPSAPFPVRPGDEAPTRHLVAFPDTLTAAQVAEWATELSAIGSLSPAIVDRANLGNDDVDQVIRWSWVGGAVLLTVMGIVIASAFAAGARRQLTTLGQLSANGASPKVLRRVLVLQGSWTGAAGALLGLGLGAAALAVMASSRDRILGRYVDSYHVNLADLVPIVVLGVLAATIAAVGPARSASRVPVLAALAGRRPQGAVPAWLTVTGVAACGAGLGLIALSLFGARGTVEGGGTVWGLTAILGGVTLLLGACAVAPGYVSVLGPVAARLGGSWRLAVRSLARQRGRTGAVVSAVCATTALMLMWSGVVQSSSAREDNARMAGDRVLVLSRAAKPGAPPTRTERALSPPPSAFVDDIRAALPGSVTHQLLWAPTGTGHMVSIADATFLDALGVGAGARRALAETGVAVFGFEGDRDTDTVSFAPSGRPPVTVRAPVIDAAKDWWSRLPPVLVTPERAAAIGLVAQPGDVVVQQDRDLTPGQRAAVEGVFEEGLDQLPRTQPAGGGAIRITGIEYARPDQAPDPFVLDAIFTAISFVFVLVVVGSSLALAATETRSERDVLTVVGASPRQIRRTSGVKAVVLTVFGAVLALPVGLLPLVLVSRIMADGLVFIVPWRMILLVVVAVPVVAGLATTSTSALALRLRPVRTSTLTFE
ncbi:MAG: FtsX-like permease family protein [Acidimicrobiales bacterium]